MEIHAHHRCSLLHTGYCPDCRGRKKNRSVRAHGEPGDRQSKVHPILLAQGVVEKHLHRFFSKAEWRIQMMGPNLIFACSWRQHTRHLSLLVVPVSCKGCFDKGECATTTIRSWSDNGERVITYSTCTPKRYLLPHYQWISFQRLHIDVDVRLISHCALRRI